LPGTFQVSLGWYSLPEVIQNSATPDQVAFLKRAIWAFRGDDIFLQKRQPADPCIEAISIDFVRVTFSGTMQQAQDYVDWLNSVYDQTIQGLTVPALPYEPIDV
jgi:hypothetical protein